LLLSVFKKENFALQRSDVIHSFIHIEHFYSASSRKLLRSAPNTSTVKQSSVCVLFNLRYTTDQLIYSFKLFYSDSSSVML